MTVNSGNHAANQLCMNYIFFRLCKMSYVNSPKYTILSRDVSICILSKWVFFPKIYQPRAANRDENTAAELWFLHFNCNCGGHRQSLEALSTDNLHGGKSTDREHPQKLNIEGVPGNLFVKAAARVEREKKERWWDRSRWGKTEKGWFGRAGWFAVTWPVSVIGLLSQWWGPWGPHCDPDLW